jgi:N-acetylglucosamine-6-sulfatase
MAATRPLAWLVWVLIFGSAWAIASFAPVGDDACEQIRSACRATGFVLEGARADNGVARNSDVVAQTRPSALKPLRPGNLPNIVLILTDDYSLNLMTYSMPNLDAMQAEGTTFSNYFVTDSLCCPSRSSIFTGKFPHNTRVFTNTPPWGGYEAFQAYDNASHTFADALQAAGYQTAMMGKYLNGYWPMKDGVAPGWSEWDVAGNGYPEFRYRLNRNGRIQYYGDDPMSYLTDVVAGLGDSFIRTSAGRPFFLEVATFAPHKPFIPAPRDADKFPGLTYPQNAAFGARPNAFAPGWLKEIPPLEPADIAAINASFRMRVQSDQAIDAMIGKLRSTLAELGLAGTTYVIFTSDNGLHLGEYSLRLGKQTPFDTDIRVPLVVVGPGVPAGRTVDDIVENIDLAPTFTEIAGEPGPTAPDGRSLMPLLHPKPDVAVVWRSHALIEHRHPTREPADPDIQEPVSGNPPSYEALRTRDALYVEYDDTAHEVGFYDTRSDPMELNNIAASLSADTLRRWHRVLAGAAACRGADACWAAQSATP